jgi:DNA modification methylase
MWDNRIISSGTMDPLDLIPNPKNWRKHPKGQAQALEGALDEIGWIQDVIVNQRTGKLLDGHLRVELAKKKGETKVPVKFVDLSEEEEAKALLILDPISSMAEADKDLLKALMDEVSTDNAGIGKLIESLASDYKIATKEAHEDDYEPPAEIETDIVRGNIIQLGRHRVMCGDSTSKEDVEWLMDGKKADVCVTSPPYPGAEMWGLSEEELIMIGDTTLKILKEIIKSGSALCWNTSDTPRGNEGVSCNVARDTITALNLGWVKRAEIIWEKGLSYLPAPWNTRRPTVPNQTHESILVFFNGERKPLEKEGNLSNEELGWNRETIWKISPAKAKKEKHIAPYPFDLAIRCLSLFSCEKGLSYDPFLGSGTTLIACEQLDRICYGMEISPQYCEVICQRWEKLTGNTRQLVNGVNT